MPRKPPPKEHQWKKGQSGNPAGYSRGRRQIDDLLELIFEQKAVRKISEAWLKKILGGDFRFLKEYLDRNEGLPSEAKSEASAGSELALAIGTLLSRNHGELKRRSKTKAKPKAKAKPKRQTQPKSEPKRAAKGSRKKGSA